LKIRYLLMGAIAVIALVLVPACGQPPSGKKQIVVTYSVLGSLVRELVGAQADVVVSAPNGLDPHDWEPSARDIERINKADLVIQNGLGLEGGLEKTLEVAAAAGVPFFTATDYIIIRHVGPGEGIPSGHPDQVIGAPDPHFWMDPISMRSVVIALAPVLTGMGLMVNSDDLARRLEQMDREVAAINARVPAEDRKLVTGHESMGYFAERYGLELVGVIIPSLSSQAGVSAADLAALKTAIAENGVKAIFTELGTSPAVARAIGDETGVKVVELTTHALPADGSYFTFMRDVATVISDALK
jgi:zinc/manganese transport system substrate-binding protein